MRSQVLDIKQPMVNNQKFHNIRDNNQIYKDIRDLMPEISCTQTEFRP